MFTNVKMANLMGPIVFGLYSYYLAIGEVGANFVRYGLHKTMVRDLVQHEENSVQLIKSSFGLGLLNLIIFLIICTVFYRQLDISLDVACVLLIIAPCIISLDFQPVYEKEHLMGWQSFYYLIQKFLFIIPIWGYILYFNTITLNLVAFLYFSTWLVILILQCIEVGDAYSIQFYCLKNIFSFKNICLLYKENLIITLCCFTGVAFGPLLRMILKGNDSETAVGIFSAGLQLMIMAKFILSQISRIGNPRMAEICKEGVQYKTRIEFVRNYLLLVLVAVLPFSLLFILFPDYIVDLFFTTDYGELIFLLPIFAVDIIFNSAGVVFTQFLISMRKDNVYFSIYVISAILSVILAYILIPYQGATGATIAFCTADSLSCIAFVIYSILILRRVKTI